jgi:FkbM family methyltransferase
MKTALESELEELLSEDIDDVIKREKSAFDQFAYPFGESIVLFGSGLLGRKTLAGLRQLSIEPLAFADNNPALWNNSIDGLCVLSPQDAAEKFGDRSTFVVTIWRAQGSHRLAHTKQQLLALNCLKVVSCAALFWKYPETFLPHYCLDLPHKISQQADQVRKAYYLWVDDSSRREYLAQLRWRMLLDFDGLPSPIPKEQYFPDHLFSLTEDDVFVDCGAFDGDTIKTFLRHQEASFSKIIALEPDQTNLDKLQVYVSNLASNIKDKITVLPLAAGARREKVYFSATGTASSLVVDTGSIEVDCAPLDEVLGDCVPNFIKMDIEGAELDALAGTRRVIQQTSPILAICVYHQQAHLWQIPLFIHSLSDQYRFFLKPHGEEGWDLVCYAVPVARLTI